MQRILSPALDLDTAESSSDALQLMRADGPYAVIIADVRLPGMNGASLLSRTQGIWPNTVRVILTGNADHPAVGAAVRRSGIFRVMG